MTQITIPTEPAAPESGFDSWCVIEIFGHERIAGRVTEQMIGGCSFIRVDVPASNGMPAYTKFYGEKAIYSILPVSEELARGALARMRPQPVDPFLLPSPAPAPVGGVIERDGPSEGGPDDDDEDD